MNGITYVQCETDGSGTLSDMLRIAIWDYQRRFGHEPKLIVLPWWRGPEMPDDMLGADGFWNHDFRGIPLRFSTESDAIELS